SPPACVARPRCLRVERSPLPEIQAEFLFEVETQKPLAQRVDGRLGSSHRATLVRSTRLRRGFGVASNSKIDILRMGIALLNSANGQPILTRPARPANEIFARSADCHPERRDFPARLAECRLKRCRHRRTRLRRLRRKGGEIRPK